LDETRPDATESLPAMSSLTTPSPYRLPAGSGLADVWWKTGRVIAKATGAETNGGFAQVELIDPFGCAPPRHIHRHEDEAFYVLAGELVVFVGDEQMHLQTGDFAFVPRGVEHAYIVTSAEARLLVTFSPAGFEELFLAVGVQADEAPEGGVLPPPDEMARLCARYGADVTGPPPTAADIR